MKVKMEQDTNENVDIAHKAFYITKTKAELVNGIPISGEDYLLMVRDQANKCAQTVIAPPPSEIKKLNLPFSYQFTKEKEIDSNLIPDKEWQTLFTTSFQAFQKCMNDKKDQCSVTSIKAKTKQEWYEICANDISEAKLEAIAHLSQQTIYRVLKFNNEWLQEVLQNGKPWNHFVVWIYSLLVYTDQVLTSKDVSILRDICRTCIELRNKYEPNSDQVIQLNIIITIISQVYRQSDLQ
ncbi:unnamed protein product [Cunninghamella blakesleeana]